MTKSLLIVSILFVLSLGLAVRSQANSMPQNGLTTYDTSKLIGLSVKSRDGVMLGTIFDLVADSNGRIDFAIVMQPGVEEFPGRLVAVPFATLTLSEAGPNNIRVVFNEGKEKFYEGPDWSGKLNDLKQAASVDRDYGIQPSWTETGKAPEDPMLLRILDARRWDLWGERPQPSWTEGGDNRGATSYGWGGMAQDF